MTNPLTDWQSHKQKLDKLYNLPPEKVPVTQTAIREWRTQIMEERAAMKKLEARLTRGQKLEAGIHPSQKEWVL